MKNNPFLQYLEEHFSENTELLKTKFKQYATLIEEHNKIQNLTAIDPSEYDEKHFLDCLLLNETYSFRHETLLDIGSGAGFPGIVLAIVYPNLKITLLEPIRKRCNFLNTVIKELALTNVEVVNKRAEDYVRLKRDEFDLVTSRAVSSLSIMLELSVPFLKINGSALMMKGRNYNTELAEADNAIYLLKVEVGKTDVHFLPSDGSMRVNARFIKKGSTPKKYPRPFAQIKKNPL
ncbi:MAG: Ribosomal RNA small subunit methyltransferase G [Tenericutes bacterium ADurb.Bin024]|nr:MAG: Ribosomal RNA small subunit methyltransferase G [Tenericutes bacterium ADurb.Bin024]